MANNNIPDAIRNNFQLPVGGAVMDKAIKFFDSWFSGSGSPEGVVTSAVGKFYMDLTNGAIYAKTSGAGNTGWEELGGGDGVAKATFPETLIIAISDETTALTTGTAKVTFRMPWAMTLTSIRASVNTASTSGVVTVDVNDGGVSVFSTTLTIDATEKTSTTAAVPAVLSDTALADDAEITIDIDTAGTGAKGLKVTFIGTRVVA